MNWHDITGAVLLIVAWLCAEGAGNRVSANSDASLPIGLRFAGGLLVVVAIACLKHG